ncbi:MAG: tRNA (adenosine(37)-N6)-dimethylallyltransferase MiaA [Clostridia bacterium]|nr:tRNA (adenosine(37)-N6)-dimethylallyltransferase MiaA [Clostridia bacterium]
MSALIRALAVAGPTAGGKTALALSLGEVLSGEIVGCDSMQIYRGFDIGTAKPTKEEMARLPHHLIDFLDPNTPYSAADYGADALRVAGEIAARGKLPVFCGGTGLYLEAARTGRHEMGEPSDPTVRAELTARAATEEGRAELCKQLFTVDPASAEAIHPNNIRRVIRALEIYLVSGKPKSVWDAESREKPPQMDICILGLFYRDRQRLYDRIEQRVHVMLKEGLYEECERLYRAGYLESGSTAAQAIGYKELLPAVRGELPLADAVQMLITATRRYAKRQLTWFSAMAGVHLLYADDECGMKNERVLLNEALAIYSQF